MRRRHLAATAWLAAGVLGGLLAGPGAPPAYAAQEMRFDQAGFAAAQRADRPILVEIDASWCPTCARQRPILARLMQDKAFAGLTIFKVDFDTQKTVVRAMGATMQSTLIAFHGSQETGRSVGATDPAAIRALLATSLAPVG